MQPATDDIRPPPILKRVASLRAPRAGTAFYFGVKPGFRAPPAASYARRWLHPETPGGAVSSDRVKHGNGGGSGPTKLNGRPRPHRRTAH